MPTPPLEPIQPVFKNNFYLAHYSRWPITPQRIPCQKQRIDTRSLINLHLMSCLLIIATIAIDPKVLDNQAILRQPEVGIMDANFPSVDYG
jgi:hypothetical protein